MPSTAKKKPAVKSTTQKTVHKVHQTVKKEEVFAHPKSATKATPKMVQSELMPPEIEKLETKEQLPAVELQTSETVTDSAKAPVETPAEKEIEDTIEPVTQTDEEISPQEAITIRVNRKLFVFFIGFALFGFFTVGAVVFYSSFAGAMKKAAPSPTSEAEATPELQPNPTATASASAQLSKISVQILNGSGISGEASVVRDLLKAKGFVKMTTGNAKSYDYTETEVRMKKDTGPEILDLVTSALTDYKVASADALLDTSTYDLVITVGKDKK